MDFQFSQLGGEEHASARISAQGAYLCAGAAEMVHFKRRGLGNFSFFFFFFWLHVLCNVHRERERARIFVTKLEKKAILRLLK